MATVVSLTKEKIQELLAGWEGVELSQDQINALVAQLWTSQATLDAMMETFNNVTLPELQTDLEANSVKVSELNDTTLPDLEATLDQANLQIENLMTVDIPALTQGLNNEIENNLARPKVYNQPDEPSNPDIDDRDLIVGDVWFETDNENLQHTWNGAEWSTMTVDIPDLSITVKKFQTSTHMIY